MTLSVGCLDANALPPSCEGGRMIEKGERHCCGGSGRGALEVRSVLEWTRAMSVRDCRLWTGPVLSTGLVRIADDTSVSVPLVSFCLSSVSRIVCFHLNGWRVP